VSVLSPRSHRRELGRHDRRRPAPVPADSLDFTDGKSITEAIADLDAEYETGPPWTGTSEPGQPDPDATGHPVADLTRLFVRGAHGIIPSAPLTLPAVIFDDMGGERTRARSCWYCRGQQGRGDLSWRYDALTRWSCPRCQMRPDWRAPSLPALAGPAAPEGAVPARVNGGAL